jgi:glycosyltransferase involved in cell wall biosynthesis
VGEALAYAPRLDDERLASLVRGARAALLPMVSESAGFAAIEAIACGTPVIASAVGALPEIVGPAGILVEPRDPGRLASALATAFVDDAVHARLAVAAREMAESGSRTWADVARDTRRIYAEVGRIS